MKTERRHELATNVLADWLGEKIEALRPYSAAVSVTALLAVVVVFAGIVLYQKRQANMAEAWSDYFSAIESQSPDEANDRLEAVAVDHPGSPAGLWSRLSLADTHLANGVEDLFKDRTAARKALDQAQEAYQAVLDRAPRESLLAERATFGLAETYESKNELEPARKHYHDLLERWPDGAFSALAKTRIADLERKTTKDFYDWFAKQSTQTKPKATGGPGEKPAFDFGNLPDESFESHLKVGGKKVDGSVKKPAGDKATPDKAAPDKATQPEGDDAPGDSQPASQKSTEEKAEPEGN